MLSLCELRRASEVLAARVGGARLQAVVQPDDRGIALTLYSGGPEAKGRHHVLLSCRAESARDTVPGVSSQAAQRLSAVASPPSRKTLAVSTIVWFNR